MNTLTAFSKKISETNGHLGKMYESNPDEDIKKLRERFAKDGYLFLKKLLLKDDVISFREWVFDKLSGTGILKENTEVKYGIANLQLEKNLKKDFSQSGRSLNPEVKEKIAQLVKSTKYEAFCSQPRLTNFIDEFIRGISYLHKRKILRHTLPNSDNATPAHYDLIYLRAGTDNIITAWIPIGDITIEEGGLMYLEGSHLEGVKFEKEFSIKNADLSREEQINAFNKNMTEGGWISKDFPDLANKFNSQWLVANYEAGDVLLHSPYLIHASTNNESKKNRIRLSTDIRFQNVNDKIDTRWSNHWHEDDNL
ncbi:phytanoyl-CoA dioxygenase family protein [Alphaproteobacteria bacterium]|nr:phytanoyl-CoA dioxygenase family protein [Alphaproteobacteria bacterium]